MRLSMPSRLARFAMATGLVLSVAAPAAGPVAAADPVVLKLGTHPGHRLGQPVPGGARRGLRGVRADLRPARRVRPEPRAGRRPSPSRGRAIADGKGLDLQVPARPEVVRRPAGHVGGRLLLLAARPRRDRQGRERRARLPRSRDQGRRRHQGRVPRPDDDDRHHERPVEPGPPDLRPDPAQAHLGQGDLQDDRRRRLQPAGRRQRSRRHRRRTSSSSTRTKQFARFKRNPNYWGEQGFADEIVMQFFASNDTHVPGAQEGRDRLRPQDQPGAVQAAPGRPDHQDRQRRARTAGPSSASTPTDRDRQDDQGWRPVDEGAPGSRVPRRARLRHRQAEARRQRDRRPRDGRHRRRSRRSTSPGTRSRPTSRTFDLALADQKLTAAGYIKDASGKRLDKQGKPISLRMVLPDYDPNFAKSGQFIRDWFAQLGITVSPKTYDSDTLVDLMLPPEAGGATQQGQLRHVHLDVVVGSRSERRPQRVQVRRHRLLVRQPLVQPRLRQALRAAARRADRGRPEGDPHPDAADVVRPGPVPHPLLRRQPPRLPDRQVRGLAEPAGQRHPAVRVRDARLHAAQGCDRSAESDARSDRLRRGSGRAVLGAQRRPALRRRHWDRRAATLPILPIAIVVVVIVVVGGFLAMRRNAAKTASDEDDE